MTQNNFFGIEDEQLSGWNSQENHNSHAFEANRLRAFQNTQKFDRSERNEGLDKNIKLKHLNLNSKKQKMSIQSEQSNLSVYRKIFKNDFFKEQKHQLQQLSYKRKSKFTDNNYLSICSSNYTTDSKVSDERIFETLQEENPQKKFNLALLFDKKNLRNKALRKNLFIQRKNRQIKREIVLKSKDFIVKKSVSKEIIPKYQKTIHQNEYQNKTKSQFYTKKQKNFHYSIDNVNFQNSLLTITQILNPISKEEVQIQISSQVANKFIALHDQHFC